MKKIYETPQGALEGYDLVKGGWRLQTERTRRPGKQVDVVELGKRYVRGESMTTISTSMNIHRKTVSRWVKRLGLKMRRRETT